MALLLFLSGVGAGTVQASDVTVTDSTGGTFFVASAQATFSWNTNPSGLGWSSGTQLALYASRAAKSLTIAGPGTPFTVANISAPSTINLTSNPVGTVNNGDTIVLTGCIYNGGINNGVYIVSSVAAGKVVVTSSALVSEVVSATMVDAPGAVRTSTGATTITTTTPHGLTALSDFVTIVSTDDSTFQESVVEVLSTPTATTFTYQSTSQTSLDSSGNGQVQIAPGPSQDSGAESQYIATVANTGSLTRALPNLIGTDVYYFLVQVSNTSNRIYSSAVTVNGVQLITPAVGDIATANQLGAAKDEIEIDLMGYPASASATLFKFVLSRDGLFSGGANDEILADLISGANSQMTAVAPTLRGCTAAYIFRHNATTWTAPLTPEARVHVLTYANTNIPEAVTDDTGPTTGDTNDPLSGNYIDWAFRIGAGSGAVPMFYPNGGEVIPRVAVSNGVQSVNTTTVRYIPLESTILPVTTIATGMLLEYSGDSGNSWTPLNAFEFTTASFTAPSTITLAAGSNASSILPGAPVVITGSSFNNGTYTVASSTATTITVSETTLSAETVAADVEVGKPFDPSSSRFQWTTTQDPSTRCRLRTRLVVGTADNGAIVDDLVDTSNADFTLRGVVWKGLSTATMMPVGSSQTLTWVSAGGAGTVNILLSRNGGLSYSTIATNAPDTGSYNWTVTGPVTSNAILYIEQADQPSPYFDKSQQFTIQGYTVVTPDGGEVFQIGSLQSVLWLSAGMPNVGDLNNAVNIDLTYTDPATSSPTSLRIASSVPNNLNYNWTLANSIPGVTDARVKISNVATPTIGPGLSDNTFTIQRSIHVTAPNGGGSYVVSEVTPVTWTTSGLPVLSGTTTYVRPELLLGTAIATAANAGLSRVSNLVTVTTAAAHGYTTGDIIYIAGADDTSFNGTFQITVASSTTFTYAQTGVDATSENGYAYKAKRVIGDAKIDSVANVGISRDNPSSTVTVKTTGANHFVVGDSVQIADVTDTTFDGVFTVTAVNTGANTFTFTQAGPNADSGGGEVYRATVNTGTPNTGSLSAVWTSGDVADHALVRVLEVNAANQPQPTATEFTNDVSDSSFSIQSFNTEAESITVTSPNGGEVFSLGQSVNITWSSSGAVTRSNTVTLRLTRVTTDGQSENVVLATNVQNTGAFSWLVTGPPTISGRIVVTSDADSTVTDASNGNFVIKGIQVLKPNSLGDSIDVGAALPISWDFGYVGVSDTVKIEISRDGGTTWSTIAAGAPNNGSYLWVSQQAVSAAAKVRVTSVGDATLTDTSDSTFHMHGITVLTPTGGETWVQGTQQNLTWTSVDTGSFVNVDLSLDGGLTFQRIAQHVTNNGSLVWTVAQPYSATKILRSASFVAGTNTINFVNPAADLTGIQAGDKVVVTGTTFNNGTYIVNTVGATSLTTTAALINETIGKDVTVTLKSITNTTPFAVTRSIQTSDVQASGRVDFVSGANLTGVSPGDRITLSGTAADDGTYVIATVDTVNGFVTTTIPFPGTQTVAVTAVLKLQPSDVRVLRTVSFTAADKTIHFGAGAILSGLAAGQIVTVAAPAINQGTYTIASVNAAAATLTVTGTLNNETQAADATVTAAATTAYYINQPSAAAMVRITDTANTAYTDTSDTAFDIPPVAPTSLAFAASPNPNPPFPFGTQSTLQWNGQGMGATATLAFSSDGGVTFTTVDTAVPNTPDVNTGLSSYLWTAPNTSTANGVLKLTSNVTPNPSISTSGVFAVTPPTVPSLVLTPTPPAAVSVTAVEAGDNPADVTGTILNVGSQTTTYTLTVPGADTWLHIALQPGTGNPTYGSTLTHALVYSATDTILFHATVGSLAPGTYTATVGMTATGSALGVAPFTVKFTVTPTGIGLVSASVITVSVPEGSSSDTVVTIQNRTSGAIMPQVSGLPAWASMTAFSPATVPASGTSSSTLTLNGVGLAPGYYTATITVDNAGSTPSRTFAIDFTVTNATISFENKSKSCSIGGAEDAYGAIGFLLPFGLLGLLWLVQRMRLKATERFFRGASRLNGLWMLLAALVLLGSVHNAQAANIGSSEEGPSLFGMDVHVPVLLNCLQGANVYTIAGIDENVPLQKANFGGFIASSGWANQDSHGLLPKNFYMELQLGFVSGNGVADIQSLSATSTTRYATKMFNARMVFTKPAILDLDKDKRIDDRHPFSFAPIGVIGVHYISVDFAKTTVTEFGRGLEVGGGINAEYGIAPRLVISGAFILMGRFQEYNNLYKDSKFNTTVEGQFSGCLSWNFTPGWSMDFQATGTITELTDFHRIGGIVAFRYTTL
ncbi:MAG: beta strand repeat-containing protein [Planctomycetota bacterium]